MFAYCASSLLKTILSLTASPEFLLANALRSRTVNSYFSDQDTGRLQINIIIDNAGVARNGILGEIEVDDYEFVFKINVLRPLLLMQALMPFLPTDRSGRIVNIS